MKTNTVKRFGTVLLALVFSIGHPSCSGPASKDYPITPVDFTAVEIDENFWKYRQDINREVTVGHAFEQCEITGRLDNFARAAGLMEGGFEGLRFNDSDVYKVIEGASYTLATHPDPELDRFLDDLISNIAAAQEEDGYLFTPLIIDPENPPSEVPKERWVGERESHELYCVGHLYEAAVAHFRATGKRSLLDVALKSADLVAREFGPGKREIPPGHQEIELGLVKLFKTTGETKYLNLAKFFLEERGDTEGRESYGEYFQDHAPVLEQNEAVGHVVRACYMYAAMADIAALTGDLRYQEAVNNVWENVVSKKIYITGGVGGGNSEGFSAEYDLPNMRAYNETCASIANSFWNHRMFLLNGDAKYLDVLERTIYNSFLSGIGKSGDLFFYPNRLATIQGEERSPWFNCACCPSNVVRFIPQIAGYIYARRQKDVFVNLFIGSRTVLDIEGTKVRLALETDYPWKRKIRIDVDPEKNLRFSLCLRLPGWTQNTPLPGGLYTFIDGTDEQVTLSVNGAEFPLRTEKGFAFIDRTWKAGDHIDFVLPLPIRRVRTDDNVSNNRGRVALCRGPLIYCAEWPDNDGKVLNLLIPAETSFVPEERKDLFGGITVIKGPVKSLQNNLDGSIAFHDHELVAIPYYAWAHRGPGPMAVWLAGEEHAAWPLPAPTLADRSRISASFQGVRGSSPGGLNDQILPASSSDQEIPRFTWWNHRGSEEWVQYDFPEAIEVTAVEVYWFSDQLFGGGVDLPSSWSLLYKDGRQWKPVPEPGEFTIIADTFNRVVFDPVTTDGLRIEVKMKENKSAGILEWRVIRR